MAGVVVSFVLDNFKGPMAHRMILVTLADHAKKDGSEARPSMQKLADRAGVSKRQARRIVSDLRRGGWIRPTTPTNAAGIPVGGRAKVTSYQIDLGKIKADKCEPVKGDILRPPLLPQRRTPRVTKADTTGHKGGHPRARVKDKPSRTVQNRPIGEAKPTPVKKPRKPDPLFDAVTLAAFGQEKCPRPEGSRIGKVTSSLRQLGATPEEFRRRWGHASASGWGTFGPEAVVKHWAALANPPTDNHKPEITAADIDKWRAPK